uniref:Golgi-associated, gamma adaptin ear containing, ARF binding protein 1 n=1 Tax=Nothobranchius furzeri TaxID=105023 RepID=A0A8C6LC49_NOTFU
PVLGFCDQLVSEPDGPPLATRLLAHKVQSPQQWEAMQALTVLETCMQKCGKRFHNEVGKFRFINELIKVVSPKYLGTRAPEPVKKKVVEMMFSWTVNYPDETKIAEAYQMLKKQGIVKQDPVLPCDKPLPPPPPRDKSAIFEDEEKSKMLSRLLKSSHPDDLRAANKLIKEMVQEDQKRVEKVSKRVNAIQEVKESVSLLSQLLEGYSKESSSQSNQELIKDLYQRCEKMRPTLFRLASDTEDNDEALGEFGTEPSSLDSSGSRPAVLQTSHAPPVEAAAAPPKAMEELDILGKTLLKQSLPPESQQVKWDKLQPQSRVSLRDLQTKSSSSCKSAPPAASSSVAPPPEPTSTTDPSDRISLADVLVPLESIKPSSLLPVTVFDKCSLRVLFTFAHDCPPSRPDVLVVIISMLSSAPIPVTNIRFQAAVPKVMKVKLQPPSCTELPAFNPILPPAAVTQILLLANPHKEKVRLRYKLTFNLGDNFHDESGDVDQFPPPNTWGNL